MPTCEVTIVGDKVVRDIGGLGGRCGLVWLSKCSVGVHLRYSRFKAACSPSIGVCPSEGPLLDGSVNRKLRQFDDYVSHGSVPEVEKLQGQL